jgi:hypothetical protein
LAKYTFATLDAWTRKSRKRLDAVVSQATNDLIADIEVVPGINRGGGRKRGTIPRDTGMLAASLQSELHGSTALSGEGLDSYVMVVGAMEAGDMARFSWGTSYARAVHYGANGVPGTFWIDVAAGKWPGYVASAVTRAKARVA